MVNKTMNSVGVSEAILNLIATGQKIITSRITIFKWDALFVARQKCGVLANIPELGKVTGVVGRWSPLLQNEKSSSSLYLCMILHSSWRRSIFGSSWASDGYTTIID